MSTPKLERKLHEVFITEPSDLGIPLLTDIYKILTNPLKTVPFIFLLPLSFILAFGLYIIFGLTLVKIVTLLQNGF